MRTPVDLRESYEGDLIFNGGDFEDTGNNYQMAIYQIIRTVLSTNPGESEIYPALGFDKDPYIGAQNNEAVGYQIAKAIKQAISQSTYLYFSELDVQPYPVAKNVIAFRIRVTTIPGQEHYYTLAYDTADNMIRSLVLDKDQSTIKVPNLPTINSRQ